MNTYNQILAKQQQCALNRGFDLVGSAWERGRRLYTRTLDENLFEPLSPSTLGDIGGGDGNELASSENGPAKMQALHSSSALGVNIFHYWNHPDRVSAIAAACGFCRRGATPAERIRFEAKYPIDPRFRYPSNIDVVIENKPSARARVFAVECKFTEAYGGYKHGGLDPKYFDLESNWDGLPALREFAESISPDDMVFQHLHPAQLVKHILGLRRKHKRSFRLLYLWYDALGEDGARHRGEADAFREIARQDGVQFHHLTYQELIQRLAVRHREAHPEYIEYVTGRYL